MRVCDKLNRGSDKFIVQYSNVGPGLYAVSHILASTLLYKVLISLSLDRFFTIAAFYVGGYLAALGAYSSTLDYSLAHSASGEGPSASSVRVAISVVRSSSKSASSEVVAACRTRRSTISGGRRG